MQFNDSVVGIPLTRGAVALIDRADLQLVEGRGWMLHAGHPTCQYAMSRDDEDRTIYMHRVLLGARPGDEVDHVDRNGLNNRRSNLRIVAHVQNVWNARGQLGKTSQFKGVSWAKRERCWVAGLNQRSAPKRFLGFYDDEVEAALAYDAAARATYGEFGFLNFPEIVTPQAPRTRRSHQNHRPHRPHLRRLKSGVVVQIGNPATHT